MGEVRNRGTADFQQGFHTNDHLFFDSYPVGQLSFVAAEMVRTDSRRIPALDFEFFWPTLLVFLPVKLRIVWWNESTWNWVLIALIVPFFRSKVPNRWNQEQERTLLMILKEALANVMKHGNTSPKSAGNYTSHKHRIIFMSLVILPKNVHLFCAARP
ncbi:hypothetical protein [Enterococcus viikkiensis]|uniref:hypothetical protein n=1 Tax=Enterococcus viikkiensis TaxID=930854 RepID=UPI0010F7752B|nr:hypothetical protein [Enterococcus viikkiensis]